MGPAYKHQLSQTAAATCYYGHNWHTTETNLRKWRQQRIVNSNKGMSINTNPKRNLTWNHSCLGQKEVMGELLLRAHQLPRYHPCHSWLRSMPSGISHISTVNRTIIFSFLFFHSIGAINTANIKQWISNIIDFFSFSFDKIIKIE